MRILTVLTFYLPHWTGLTAHAARAAEELAARGHAVTVLASQHEPGLPLVEEVNGVRVVRLPHVGRFSRGVIMPSFPFRAAQLIRRHDVVHVHTPLPEGPLVGVLCAAFRKPLVMTHHGDVVMPAGLFNQFVQRAAYGVLLGTGTMADAVTVYSGDYAEHSPLLRHFMHKLHPIYPPVDIPQPDPAAVAAWREELDLTGKLLVGFAGRWVEEKGFDYLLQAIPLVAARVPGVHFAYAGEMNVNYDPFFRTCESLIRANQDRISLLGLIRDPQRLANFYGMCDLIAVPSRTDNMPLVEIEALLCGTPLVVSDIPGARVVVQKTGFGRLTPPNDPATWADTIVETLLARDRYAPTYSAVRALFDSQRTIDAYERLMREAIHTRAGRSRSAS